MDTTGSGFKVKRKKSMSCTKKFECMLNAWRMEISACAGNFSIEKHHFCK